MSAVKDREARLAAQLRANLRRRKAQARRLAESQAGADAAEPAAAGGGKPPSGAGDEPQTPQR